MVKNIEDFECCPHCGHDEWYRKQRAQGIIRYNQMFSGSEAENGDMYSGLSIKDISKYAFCSNCNKKVGLIE